MNDVDDHNPPARPASPIDPLHSLGTSRSLVIVSDKGPLTALLRWFGQTLRIVPRTSRRRFRSEPFAPDIAMALDAASSRREENDRMRMQFVRSGGQPEQAFDANCDSASLSRPEQRPRR